MYWLDLTIEVILYDFKLLKTPRFCSTLLCCGIMLLHLQCNIFIVKRQKSLYMTYMFTAWSKIKYSNQIVNSLRLVNISIAMTFTNMIQGLTAKQMLLTDLPVMHKEGLQVGRS